MASGRLVDYLGSGIIADRPAAPTLIADGLGLWYATDTNTLSAWDGSTWEDVAGSVASVNGATGTVVLDAGDIGITDAGGYFTGTDVEAALQELGAATVATDVRTETASYTAALGDCVVEMNVASANNFTVPANASQAFPVGAFLEVWQMGAGQTTIVPDTGVTVLYNADLTLSLKGVDSGCSLRKVATNTWRLIGDMELAP